MSELAAFGSELIAGGASSGLVQQIVGSGGDQLRRADRSSNRLRQDPSSARTSIVREIARKTKQGVSAGPALSAAAGFLGAVGRRVLSAMVAAFDSGNVDDGAAFVDASYIDHHGLDGEEIRGADGFARVVRAARTGLDGLAVAVQDLIAEGNRAAERVQWTGIRALGDAAEHETVEMVHVNARGAIEHWRGRSWARSCRVSQRAKSPGAIRLAPPP